MPNYYYNQMRLIEAAGDPRKFRIALIRPGLSLNRVMYSEEILRAATPMFEGVRSLARSDREHIWGDGKSVKNLVGFIDNVEFTEGIGITGDFNVMPAASWLTENLNFAIENNKLDMFGFSIVAEGVGHEDTIEGERVRVVDMITAAKFVDVVVDPGAGGQAIEISEATKLGNWLSKQVDAGKATVAELAKAAGISVSTVGQIMRGEIERPPDNRLRGFARALGVSFDTVKAQLSESEYVYTEGALAYNDSYISGMALCNLIEARDNLPEIARLSGRSRDEVQSAIDAYRDGQADQILIEISEAAGIGYDDRLSIAAQHLDPTYGDFQMRERLLRLLEARRPDLYANINPDRITDTELINLVEGFIGEGGNDQDDDSGGAAGGQNPGQQNSGGTSTIELTEATNRIANLERTLQNSLAAINNQTMRLRINEAVAASGLASEFAQHVRDDLLGRLDAGTQITESMIADAIQAEQGLVNRLSTAGIILGEGQTSVQTRQDEFDKAVEMIGDVFDDKKDVSLKEAYINLTGDEKLYGTPSRKHLNLMNNFVESHEERYSEAVTTSSFDSILSEFLHRRMVEEYEMMGLNDWMSLVRTPTTVPDFRTQRRVRWGGYPNLPVVNEKGNYLALTTGADEEVTFSVSKYGGTEELTIEAIANDDVDSVRLIPVRMGQAAARTLYEFVLDFLNDNPNVYDGNPLFDATHNNLNTVAFSKAQYLENRRKMRNQTMLSVSNAHIGIMAAHLWIPGELDESAFNAFVRDTNNDPDFAQSVRPMIHVVEYWTDDNNWYVTANPRQAPVMEVGFWRSREPRIFVQDNPTQGSLFTNDVRTYKISHVYGATVIDWRSFQGNIVA